MPHPLFHAESSVRRFGGRIDDYLPLHTWMDASKASFADFRHRALRHHSFGIFEAEHHFGVAITLADGRRIPVRLILELHVKEDCGGVIPTVADWLAGLPRRGWMSRGYGEAKRLGSETRRSRP
jgi:hypothetical protein